MLVLNLLNFPTLVASLSYGLIMRLSLPLFYILACPILVGHILIDTMNVNGHTPTIYGFCTPCAYTHASERACSI